MGNCDPKAVRAGRPWHETANDPMPAGAGMRKVLALGTCDRDGSNFKPYPQPIEREVIAPTGSYIWLED